MAKKVIITISRQYGSGGKMIGEKLAEALGIRCYDKVFLENMEVQCFQPLLISIVM